MGIARLFTDAAQVQTCTGQQPSPSFAAAASVACFAQFRQETVRDPDGIYTPCSLILYAATADTGKFTFGSKVTAKGHDGYVIAAFPFQHGPASAWHVKVLIV